ncbi:hypothetical protein, partial [Salmonella sp. s60131]|uniref:hypothetical protein n=1 Tax=Salmonella sp. s60131 TaxID=3159722 RepID=UPI00397FC7D0
NAAILGVIIHDLEELNYVGYDQENNQTNTKPSDSVHVPPGTNPSVNRKSNENNRNNKQIDV